MSSRQPFLFEQLVDQLNTIFEVEFTFIDSESVARLLLDRNVDEQYFYLQWTQRIASTQIPLAYKLIKRALQIEPEVEPQFVEQWALYTMDIYDRSGLQQAMALASDPQKFQQHYREETYGTTFEEVESVLSHFVHGLTGRNLKLSKTDGAPYTDTETIFLPAIVASQVDKQKNFELYKAMVVFIWSQTRYGTFREPINQLQKLLDSSQQLLDLFLAIERKRLELLIADELPGIHRLMQNLHHEDNRDPVWDEIETEIHPEMDHKDVIRLTEHFIEHVHTIPGCCYQGTIEIEQVISTQQQRIDRERSLFKVELDKLLKEQNQQNKREQLKTELKVDYQSSTGLNHSENALILTFIE